MRLILESPPFDAELLLKVEESGGEGKRMRAMVASAEPLASQVGIDVMRRGGNAVDAAVAVGFALTVTYPQAGNLGGGGFLLWRRKDGKTAAIDYREMAPGAAFRDVYAGKTDEIGADRGLPPEIQVGLERLGHVFGKPRALGDAQGILIAPDGTVTRASDPRGSGQVAAG